MPEIIIQIFQLCIIPLFGILTKYLVDYLNARRDELNSKTENEIAEKYTTMIFDTITKCVIATNQTYVNSLKEQGAFDAEAQKIAFNKTMNSVLGILSNDAKQYIIETTGDLNTYLTNLIEAAVSENRAS